MRGKELNKIITTDLFWEKQANPKSLKKFIYTSNQLNDKNATRQSNYRWQLQQFLELESSLKDFNMNLFLRIGLLFLQQ